MKLKKVLGGLALSVVAFATAAAADWPERAVTIIVPAGAGGGTDATGRILADFLRERFGQPFNVVNQGEAGGFVGMSNMTTAVPDGYTLGILFNYAHFELQGIGDMNHKMFTPIAQFNFDPAGISVAAGSELMKAADVVAALRADPGSLVITCGGSCGNAFDTTLAQLLLTEGVDVTKVRFIPTQGAAAGLQDLVAGAVDVSPSSLPETRALVEAGEVRPIAIFGGQRNPLFPDVATIEEQMGHRIDGGAWRALVAPAGLPQDITSQLEEAMAEIVASEAFQSQLSSLGFGVLYRNSSDLKTFMQSHEEGMREVLSALGMIDE